ncbi:hypothetical protein NOR51B_990 [Luminiphilus syltensis NOR5-1B]|uniref:Uncharacterized protein n=1 Tax=Luminiphilus syltensis NOR5-1B TaxID=565045 RepID=B8KUP8_9GAMM|nr:hypothetical protein NOR51B_990 [Luminiphilus syltensis NOR5-1B]
MLALENGAEYKGFHRPAPAYYCQRLGHEPRIGMVTRDQ